MKFLFNSLLIGFIASTVMLSGPALAAPSNDKGNDKGKDNGNGKNDDGAAKYERGKRAYKKALEAALASEKIEAKHKYDLSFVMKDLQWLTRDHTDYKGGALVVGFSSHGKTGTGEAVRADAAGEDPVAFTNGAVRLRLASRKTDSAVLKDCEQKMAEALKSGQSIQVKATALPKFTVFVTPREFLYAYARDLMEEKILKWLAGFENRDKDRKRLDRGTKALAEIADQVVIRRGIGINVDTYAVSCELLGK